MVRALLFGGTGTISTYIIEQIILRGHNFHKRKPILKLKAISVTGILNQN
jgi:hypothetical protein